MARLEVEFREKLESRCGRTFEDDLSHAVARKDLEAALTSIDHSYTYLLMRGWIDDARLNRDMGGDRSGEEGGDVAIETWGN